MPDMSPKNRMNIKNEITIGTRMDFVNLPMIDIRVEKIMAVKKI